jgi:hypothetical protein
VTVRGHPLRQLFVQEPGLARALVAKRVERGVKLLAIGRVLVEVVADMLAGKYAALKDVAPTHMTDACCAKAFVLADGIIVRHDLKQTSDEKGFVGILEGGDLASAAPQLSGSFVHCPVEADGYDPGANVMSLTFSVAPSDGSAPERALITQRLCAVAARPAADSPPKQIARRPVPLVSLRNEFDIRLFGELCAEQPEADRPFIVRSRVKLPLGWEAFEVFPPYEHNLWDPVLAPYWAESDLLASIVQRNLLDAHFRSIDPSAEARREAGKMLGCQRWFGHGQSSRSGSGSPTLFSVTQPAITYS